MQPRELALKILYDIEKNAAYLNISFQNHTEAAGLSARDAAFVKELVYGVTKRRLTLDYAAAQFSTVRLKKMAPYVLCLLRLGLYQLFYMDKVPQSAAVNEAVKLAGKYAPRSRGFVNAVLRRAAREGLQLPEGDSLEALSLRYSHPLPLVEWMLEQFGGERAKHLMEENNRTPSLCLRVNTLRTDRDSLAAQLTAEGLSVRYGDLSPHALLLESGGVQQLAAYREGLFTLQDQSAQLAALALAPGPGDTIYDVCAAPGGKTTHMAELMENRGRILALDIYEKRLAAVENAAERLGITIIEACAADGAAFDFPEPADKILVDAPCSGLGVIRRRPDIKYKEDITAFDELVCMQKRLLDHCAGYLKPGGLMVYSTCTVNPAENEAQVRAFLERHSDFKLTPPADTFLTETAKKLLAEGMGTVYPEPDSGDGFFIACLKRSSHD